MNMIKLNCPSCNGKLELPDNLGVAHCMYCGTKILLEQNANENESITLEHYIELKNVALKAKNYEEALQYCNSILEIDPKNVYAWIDKAVSTFYHITDQNSYEKSREYLKKAEQIAPGDSRIEEVRKKLAYDNGIWLYNRGIKHFNQGQDIFDSTEKTQSLGIAFNFLPL
jgi:tetratricopeptide (TPR) repeat protein